MIEELLDIFYNDGDPVGYVDGRDIIEKMGLADQKYLDDYDNRRNGMTTYDNTMKIDSFFKGFCYDSRVLESRFWYLDRQPLWFKTGMAKRNKIENSFG
jgi:hypothetical protein